MAPPSLLGPPELHKSSPTTTAPPPPEPESKPQGLELESPTRKASIWRRFGSTSTTPKLACNLPSFSEFGYFKDLPEIVYRLLESEDVRKKQKAEWRERKCTGRQEATGIRIRRRNRVELREEENRKKERKMESEEDDSVSEVLRDRFRLSTISIADAEAKRSGMEISESVVACISDLASKFTGLFALETWSNKQCQAFPKLEVGGGINSDNSLQYIEEGASHVIVTSYVFNNGQNLERLKDLVRVVGKERLVLDLSCRKREGKYAIVTDRWQKFSDVYLDKEILDFLAKYADEFLVHGVDVEGKKYLHELLTQRDEFDTIALLIRHLHIIVKETTLYVLKWLIIYRVWLPT